MNSDGARNDGRINRCLLGWWLACSILSPRAYSRPFSYSSNSMKATESVSLLSVRLLYFVHTVSAVVMPTDPVLLSIDSRNWQIFSFDLQSDPVGQNGRRHSFFRRYRSYPVMVRFPSTGTRFPPEHETERTTRGLICETKEELCLD